MIWAMVGLPVLALAAWGVLRVLKARRARNARINRRLGL